MKAKDCLFKIHEVLICNDLLDIQKIDLIENLLSEVVE